MVQRDYKYKMSHESQDSNGHYIISGTGRITVDAVHPFFKGYRNQLTSTETSTEDDLRYHCKQCGMYFDKTKHSVLKHFTFMTHKPVDSCVYCKGSVYDYFYNQTRHIYHRCKDSHSNNQF